MTWNIVVAAFCGLVGGVTYTLILLNPGLKFSTLGVSRTDFAWALAINSFLGAVAGFLGWSFAGGNVAVPRAYGFFVLCGVGGGSLIQNWAFTIGNVQSKATLDRALEAVESLSKAHASPEGGQLVSLSRSLRSETSREQRSKASQELVELANRIAAQSGR